MAIQGVPWVHTEGESAFLRKIVAELDATADRLRKLEELREKQAPKPAPVQCPDQREFESLTRAGYGEYQSFRRGFYEELGRLVAKREENRHRFERDRAKFE